MGCLTLFSPFHVESLEKTKHSGSRKFKGRQSIILSIHSAIFLAGDSVPFKKQQLQSDTKGIRYVAGWLPFDAMDGAFAWERD